MFKFPKALFFTLPLFVLVSCASTYQLDSDGEKVEVLKRKPKDCNVMGKVQGEHEKGSIELARNMTRNKAGDLGADSLYIDEEVSNGSHRKVFATAYKCQ